MSQGAQLIRGAGPIHAVAAALGVSPRLLCSWRSGEHKPAARWREAIEHRLGISSQAWDRDPHDPAGPMVREFARALGERLLKRADEIDAENLRASIGDASHTA